METTELLGYIVFICLIAVACFLPYFYKKAVQKRFAKLQESAIQFELFEYCGSVAQNKSIISFYLNKATNKVWYTHKRINGSRVTESVLIPCEMEIEDILMLELNGQEKGTNKNE